MAIAGMVVHPVCSWGDSDDAKFKSNSESFLNENDVRHLGRRPQIEGIRRAIWISEAERIKVTNE